MGSTSRPAYVPDCDGYRYMEDVGPACPVEHGWRLYLPDGSSVLTHGPDSEPGTGAGDGSKGFAMSSLEARPDPPVCVGSSEYRNRLIYARPTDVANRSDEILDRLRQMVYEANGFIQEEARAHGYTIDFKFRCSATGTVAVDIVELPHKNAEASFSQVVSDLKDLGYNDTREKYWVWYDDQANAVAPFGIAQSYANDTDAVDNPNNRGPSYAVTFGVFVSSTMLHEAAHTMGAVQHSAPHHYNNSGGSHCYDERDLMCYGPNASPTYCPVHIHFDCGNDDYFHPDPPTESYLDTHWNIGSDLNRFIVKDTCSSHQRVNDHAYRCGPAANFSTSGDAEAHRLGVSTGGDASGTVALSLQGDAWGSIAVSKGDAHGNAVGLSPDNHSSGAVAVSGLGESEAATYNCAWETRCVGGLALSGTNNASTWWRGIAVSGTGNASSGRSLGTAVSGTGDASGLVAYSPLGTCYGQMCQDVTINGSASGWFLAVSGTGPATADKLAVSGTDNASTWGGIAISGTGNASDCWFPNSQAANCFAISGTGDSRGDTVAASGTGSAQGGVAVSGTGPARGGLVAVSACNIVSELCIDPDGDNQLDPDS